jgi:hypothetical protein
MSTNSLQFNYISVNNDGQNFVARVLEEPTYAKIELDPSQEYNSIHTRKYEKKRLSWNF